MAIDKIKCIQGLEGGGWKVAGVGGGQRRAIGKAAACSGSKRAGGRGRVKVEVDQRRLVDVTGGKASCTQGCSKRRVCGGIPVKIGVDEGRLVKYGRRDQMQMGVQKRQAARIEGARVAATGEASCKQVLKGGEGGGGWRKGEAAATCQFRGMQGQEGRTC